MDYSFITLILLLDASFCLLPVIHAQHENIPYQDVQKICETCVCLKVQDTDKRYHHMLSCAIKNFQHILARWPEEFGLNHNGITIVATFSGNSISLLQQLPATNASLTFSCRHCGIKDIQAPTFVDAPNIKHLDLSWNEITSEELTPDVFRGPYRTNRYEPIALTDLNLSHNKLKTLDKKLFEHTPNITKLNLSYNKFNTLDSSTVTALASANNLEIVDLSHTGLQTISDQLFRALIDLKSLNLAYNEFKSLPLSLQLIGKSLENLNFAGNLIKTLSETNFLGLKSLKSLNISDNFLLKSIENGTFTRLEALENLHCSHNPKLQAFDLDGLMQSHNLTQLDISYCSITTLSMAMGLSQALSNNSTSNVTAVSPWRKLRVFETVGNPWVCDCNLLKTLEFAGAHHRHKELETRCDSPYILSGTKLSNLTSDFICALRIPKKYRIVDDDPPRFLRKRYIILTAIAAAVVIVIGLLIGFVVVCIRRRLKNNDFGIEPIRYTSVRHSNLSAFAHVNPVNNRNGHA